MSRLEDAEREAMVLALESATVDELVALYLHSGDFWGVGSYCFSALQKRPGDETFAKVLELAASRQGESRSRLFVAHDGNAQEGWPARPPRTGHPSVSFGRFRR